MLGLYKEVAIFYKFIYDTPTCLKQAHHPNMVGFNIF